MLNKIVKEIIFYIVRKITIACELLNRSSVTYYYPMKFTFVTVGSEPGLLTEVDTGRHSIRECVKLVSIAEVKEIREFLSHKGMK